MGLNNIKFNLGQGGLGRPLPGADFISGLIFYTGSLPSGFSTTNRIKKFFSISDAESAGIKGDYSDGTSASGTYTVTAIGVNGDSVALSVNDMFNTITQLGTYTKAATETTVTAIAAAIVGIINSGTINHGFKASNAAGVVTIVAPKTYGVYLNTGTHLVATLSAGATLAGTVVQFTGGAASIQAVWHYHISEFFRMQPGGNLYVGFFAVPGTYNFAEVATMQTFANGTIRQIGVYKDASPLAANGADLIQLNAACQGQVTAHKELIGLLGADISGTADISTLYDNSQLTANLASLIISQDGAAVGAALFLAYGKSITNLGAALGAVALASVAEDIANPARFNVSDGIENDTIAFANGVLYSDPSITDPLLTQLQNYRYIFLRKFTGYAGSFFNEEASAINLASDYAFISNNRTIQKATRGIYAALVPYLNSVFRLSADGTIPQSSCDYYTTVAESPLDQMVRDTELSDHKVTIDPTQNVLGTGQLVLAVVLVPLGVARNIIVNIGFDVSVSS